TMGDSGDAWMPFFSTLFLFILTSNILGLIPMFPTVTSNVNVTSALAAMTFFCVVAYGTKCLGPLGFFKNMVPEGIPKIIACLLLVIETLGIFIRNFVLAIRLFANMMAGHFVIISLLALIFIVHPLAAAVAVPMALFINLLEMLVAIIQALVFTLLSALFISAASSHH
ncbi:MAG TPA: F0F1 ATP synthase subunit A, partial [Victivallales bacterium]|nr:F0F1 ATP synthase subunit A [Victivallales bacterium]